MSMGEANPVPTTAPPTCYRHPDRETYVRCQRCDRPICPDCMRPAAVGFQCPECVAAGGRTAAQPRTVLGGAIRPGNSVVTTTLIALNVFVFLLQQTGAGLERRFGLVPVAVDRDGQYYRLITAAFLHANVLHILFNMWALYVVGSQLEQTLGRSRYLTLYVLSALGGSTLYYLVAPIGSNGVGASGAVFGLFGALFVVARRLALDSSGIVTIIVINIVFSFTFPNVAWQAHLGGLITGALLAAAYAYSPRPLRRAAALAAPTGLAVLLAIGVLARTASLATG